MSDAWAKIAVALLELVGKALWPAAILCVAYSYRQALTPLLGRLASAKLPYGEFVFQTATVSAPPPSEQNAKADFETGTGGFLTKAALRSIVDRSKLLAADETITGNLLIFSTPTQKTWLFATTRRVFVLLDDQFTRESSQVIQTVFEKKGTTPLKISSDDGIGAMKFLTETDDEWWYYSTHLFPKQSDIAAAVERLLVPSVAR